MSRLKSESNRLLDFMIESKYEWPGGYRRWAAMADGGTLCAEAIVEEQELIRDSDDPQWRIVSIFVNWEGGPLTCDHTGESFPSEYEDCPF